MRKSISFVLIPAAMTSLILSFFILWISAWEPNADEVESRAYEELETAVETRKEYFCELLEARFFSLESLSYYFGAKGEGVFPEERAYTEAAILANHYSNLCLVDLSGNAYSSEGEKLGNISDSLLFTEASRRKGQRAVQYMEQTALGDGAGFYAAAPIRENNVLVGILCAGFEPTELDGVLVADGFGGNEIVFVTDSSGNILLRNGNAQKRMQQNNFFGAIVTGNYTEDQKYYALMQDLSNGEDGRFRASNAENCYGVCAPLGINDWYLFSMVKEEDVRLEYSGLQEKLLWGFRSIRNIFLLLALITAIMETAAYYVAIHVSAATDGATEETPKEKEAQELPQQIKAEEESCPPVTVTETEIVAETSRNVSIFARTFGYFDLFVDGEPLHFTNPKEKELLAVLVDRNGGTLSAEEAIGILWEDEPSGEKQLTRYRKLASRLKATLTDAGCGELVISAHGVRHLDVGALECDYYEVLKGNIEAEKKYHGVYMMNYSWAEETTAALNRLLGLEEEF